MADQCKLNADLVEAAGNGETNAVGLLIANGAENYDEALQEAAEHGHLRTMELLLERLDDKYLVSAMTAAARSGNTDAMKLVYPGRKMDLSDAVDNAAEGGFIPALELLKEWGAMEETEAAEGRDGATPLEDALQLAASRGHTDAMELLKKWGATDFETALGDAKTQVEHCAYNAEHTAGGASRVAKLKAKGVKAERAVALLKQWIKE